MKMFLDSESVRLDTPQMKDMGINPDIIKALNDLAVKRDQAIDDVWRIKRELQDSLDDFEHSGTLIPTFSTDAIRLETANRTLDDTIHTMKLLCLAVGIEVARP